MAIVLRGVPVEILLSIIEHFKRLARSFGCFAFFHGYSLRDPFVDVSRVRIKYRGPNN